MIIDTLIDMITGVVLGVLSYFPASPIDMSEITDGVTSIAAMAGALNNYVPLYAIFGSVAILALLRFQLVAWNFSVWIYHQFWGSD